MDICKSTEDLLEFPEVEGGDVVKYVGEGRHKGSYYLVSAYGQLVNVRTGNHWSSFSSFGGSAPSDWKKVEACLKLL